MSELEPIGEILPQSLPNKPEPLSPDEAVLSEREELTLELMEFGVSMRKAEQLVTRYPLKKLRRQIRWLPLRGPKRPASLLIASIENNYDAPAYADKR